MEVDNARMTGTEYVINQLGMALQAAEQRIAQLQAELDLARRPAPQPEPNQQGAHNG